MIDRARAADAFRTYVSAYDPDNSMIRHKVEHTFRVAGNCERIALSLGMDAGDTDFAWFLGLLHDIGRFEQVRRYGTFVDSVSVDHAEFGADLLFHEKLISAFPSEGFTEQQMRLLETAVRLHNKLALPESLDERTLCFCTIIRDADKADIFRVVAELPFEVRAGSSKGLLQEGEEAGEAVMNCVLQHRCVPREIRRTRFEVRIAHCCMAFEVVYPETRKIIREQGFLSRLLEEYDDNGKALWNEKECSQLRLVRAEVEAAWGEPLNGNDRKDVK